MLSCKDLSIFGWIKFYLFKMLHTEEKEAKGGQVGDEMKTSFLNFLTVTKISTW